MDYLDCEVYPTSEALVAARAQAILDFRAAIAARDADLAAAVSLTTCDETLAANDTAYRTYNRALTDYRRAQDGFVVNDVVRSGVLLIAGHLYANREEVMTGPGAAAVTLPMGAQSLLWPHRRGIGF